MQQQASDEMENLSRWVKGCSNYAGINVPTGNSGIKTPLYRGERPTKQPPVDISDTKNLP
jgi:hypothetical protein